MGATRASEGATTFTLLAIFNQLWYMSVVHRFPDFSLKLQSREAVDDATDSRFSSRAGGKLSCIPTKLRRHARATPFGALKFRQSYR